MIDLDPSSAFAVPDFAVQLTQTEHAGGLIEFVSPKLGLLAHFPAWEHADRDLRHFVASDVPLGTRDEPYDDRDERWRIVIFEEGGWIYVAEGDDPNAADFISFFRVSRDRYFAAWAAVIDQFNPITPLDATPEP